MKITVRIKDVYGSERIYPVSNKNEIETLTGQKTLSRRHCAALKMLGHTIEVETETIV